MFLKFLLDSKDDAGARTRFQRLISDLVAASNGLVGEVAGPGGFDWGIDTYAGVLNGDVHVWQCKFFFPKWEGETQRKQVRASFKEVMEKAAAKGFKVKSWTLCVPCILPPGEQTWFDTWRAKQQREHKVRIDMWNGAELRRKLQLVDCAGVRTVYFSDLGDDEPADLAELRDPSILTGTLFVAQLEAAGQVETDAAKGYYFAAEALARGIADRGAKAEVEALKEIEIETHGTWESHFNAALPSADVNGRMSGLVTSVTDAVGTLANPTGLALRPAHKKGLMHRLVELARAGWVGDWRARAEAHSGPAGSEAVAADMEGSGDG